MSHGNSDPSSMNMPRFFRLFRLPLLALALAACQDALRPEEHEATDLTASVVLGDAQTGVAGSALGDSVVVRVTDRGGSPVGGLPLEWRVLAEGGALLAARTETDRDGRSANVWVLGEHAGPQMLEVRALLSDGAAVLDTVRATARAGAAYSVRLAPDTTRLLAVGDTFRVGMEAADRYGNPVPSGEVAGEWASLNPDVVAASSSGKLTAKGIGVATVELRTGTARVRATVPVSARVEAFPLATPLDASGSPGVGRIRGNGRWVAATGVLYYPNSKGNNQAVAYSFDGSRWTVTGGRFLFSSAGGPLHVTRGGTGYAHLAQLYASEQGGAWKPDSTFGSWFTLAGSGDALFGIRAPGYAWDERMYRVERSLNGATLDLRLPEPYSTSALYTPSLAAAGESELYLSTGLGVVYWNGSAWSLVEHPEGNRALLPRLMESPSNGGTVYGVVASNQLYAFRGGRAERVVNPLEGRDETITGMGVDPEGNPYLAYARGVVFRTAQGWREYRVPDGVSIGSGVWPDGEGRFWIAGMEGTGAKLRFWRVQVR
ncbi:MAG: hypothetical protein JO040_06375 [Gemmatimonadetes bacterium]|nr:hypothetical protein [Gemmatimonadota bacterium]